MADQYDLFMDGNLEITPDHSDEEGLESDDFSSHTGKPSQRFFKPETNTVLVIMLICSSIFAVLGFVKYEHYVCYRTYIRDQAAANNATLQANLEAINATYANFQAELGANPGSTGWFSFKKVLKIPSPPRICKYFKLPDPCLDIERRGLFLMEHLSISLTNTRAGRWHTFFTYQLTHGNLLHLFLNMYQVWTFGRPILHLFGLGHFVMIWSLGGLNSGLFSVIAQSAGEKTVGIGFVETNSVGASGSLYALMVVLAIAASKYKVRVFPLVPILNWYNSIETGLAALFTLWALKGGWKLGGRSALSKDISIDDAAHFGGLVLGVLYWLLVLRRRRDRRDRAANVRRLRSL